ncbi:hypothetical protein CVT24_003944 [Panaeolus cyanescens]|uniref:Mechanosensitive ion channel protein n=1 Tax=Panaeolus cyanescens TaxID=181874 RepID=A0A409Y6P8_9AGAR|nr:hypothetical protein CVT24_003944 [Panaeolus cyanescens]
MATYPPRPVLEHQSSSGLTAGTANAHFSAPYDAERGITESEKGSIKLKKKRTEGYEEIYPGDSSHSVYPDGDNPKSKVGRLYNYLINVSIVTRWILFIVPVLGLLWLPGILQLTTFPNANIWTVKLLWWSIWFSVVWGGWWVALAVSRIVPSILRSTIGVVAVSTRRYIDWLQALHRYIALFAWSLCIWVTWNPLIDNHLNNPSQKSSNAVKLIGKLLFGIFICSAVLLFEKFSIQWIAGKFHERSYAERIADQKFAVRSLVTLYKYSSDIPGRTDVLEANTHTRGQSVNPKMFLKKLRQGVKIATTTTATVFGNVASEIAGSSVLQPNAPQAIIKTALESANKSRLLARRLFYSFAKPNTDYLEVDDIQRFFPDKEQAAAVFALFDKDDNGDASREEVEMACLEFHREQLSIENSMRDLDSAVGRLDNIFMSLYVVIAALIIAITLEASLAAVVTGAGTLILGLSWLIGGSLQEVLSSIIFLFIKHPFDVGDRVVINKETYTVKEIRLLSTVFLDSNNACVQAPNNQLNTLFIQNVRRSPQVGAKFRLAMSETFTFDVSYSTSFEDLEKLREKMLQFVETERRDYQPSFDVKVKDFPDQAKMTLSADIKYKSNGQQAALKAKRRNKWICALKTILGELKIYGPSGDPSPPPSVSRYTAVPWSLIEAEDRKAQTEAPQFPEARVPAGGWNLGDKNAAILDSADEVFGDSAALHMTSPRRGFSETTTPLASGERQPHAQAGQTNVFEMQNRQ